MCAGLAFATGCHGQCGSRSAVGVSDSEAIVVSGDGEALGRPDRVRLNLGVEAKAETLDAAMKDATARVTKLREALLKLGVTETDLKTGQFSIQQVREPVIYTVTDAAPAAPAAPATPAGKAGKPLPTSAPAVAPAPITRTEERWIERYVVTNMLEVVYPDLTRAGDLITAAVNAGANNSWGLQFEVADPKPLEGKAREVALADAKKRAEQIAAATGVKLGRVLSVTDGSSDGGGGPVPMYFAKAQAMDASMPIEGGQTKVRLNVRVVYAIEH